MVNNGFDRAQIDSKRFLNNFGFDRDVQMASVLRRIENPIYGQPADIQIDSLQVNLLEGTYYTLERNQNLELSWHNDSFNIKLNNRWEKLSAISDKVFYIQEREPERIIIRSSENDYKTIYYIAGGNTMKFEK